MCCGGSRWVRKHSTWVYPLSCSPSAQCHYHQHSSSQFFFLQLSLKKKHKFINNFSIKSYNSIHTGHFIGPLCLQNCLNSSCHRFNKVLETFLRDFGSYYHDSITQLLQICRLHIHDVNLSFHHIPKVLYWIEIWWLWRPLWKHGCPLSSRSTGPVILNIWQVCRGLRGRIVQICAQ